MKLEIGYENAYEYLHDFINRLKSGPEKIALKQCLNDFKYCIDKTKKCEKYEEAFKLIKENEQRSGE